MPRFSYTITDSAGKKIIATEKAQSKDSLVSALQAKGYFVIRIEQETEEPKKEVEIVGKKAKRGSLRLRDLVTFARQLATMLDAGVTLLKSIDIISLQVESKKLQETLVNLKKDLEKGLSLSSGLAKYPKVFDQFWVSISEVGEASGTLPQVLNKMAVYLEKKAAFQAKVISALFDPIILVVLSSAAVAFFAYRIIPTFDKIFQSLHMELPILTQGVLIFFNFIRRYFLLLFLGICAIIYAVRRYVKTPAGRKKSEAVLFRIPVLGNFFKVAMIARFTSQMSILIDSGVPILYTLEITQRMMGEGTIGKVIEDIKNNVREGKLVANPMIKSGFFPPMVIQMIMIGEETGQLGAMLKKVAQFYEEYIDTFTERLTTLFEPFALIVMGLLVGTIVIAMFLPIINMATMRGFG